MPALLSSSELRERYEEGLADLRRNFERLGDGGAVVHGRTLLVDDVIKSCHHQLTQQESVPADCVAIVALGGYGRAALLPHSDVDLLFLFDDAKEEAKYKDRLSQIYLDLWDLKIRASATARIVSECGRLDAGNVEFTVSLLESRFITGRRELFEQVRAEVLPSLLRKNAHTLTALVVESARSRHHKYANTIYHLEPNVKEGPGGLRDYNLACWLSLVNKFRDSGEWPDAAHLFEAPLQKELDSASRFLMSVRCFLHYRNGRDDNVLNWEAQDSAAVRAIGVYPRSEKLPPSHWMREYFRNARSVYGASIQLLEEAPRKQTTLRTRLRRWHSRNSNVALSMVDGAVVLASTFPTNDASEVLQVFERLAAQPLRLTIQSQRRLIESAPLLSTSEAQRALWPHLRNILKGEYAADALRAMRDCGLLDALLPEFKLIDALVIRDFFHRYTVDEHSFLTIETLHRLKGSRSEWKRRFAEILNELEKPELLFLSLLLHDIGKGLEGENHVAGSVATGRDVLVRLGLSGEEQETVEFLIQNHLEMSATMRRDIFELRVVRALAEKVGTPELLKMLTLLTYADISSVNPEAMTEWKAENLWHVYAVTANFLNRHADEEIVHGLHGHSRDKFQALPPKLLKQLESFLEGLPQRYLRIYSTDQIVRHFELASRLWQENVQVTLTPYRDLYEFTVVTNDKPFLFATLAGALSAWGMEIVTANAFSNSKSVVVDCFHFKDRFRTLDLNPSEHERLRKSVVEVVRGDRSLEHLMRARSGFDRSDRVRVHVETRILTDDESSAHSTLLEVVAQDRPGLLYKMAQTLAELNCNIEIALIDTEGEMALDVFYLTSNGSKLPTTLQDAVRGALQEKLGAGGKA